jgi:two-component system CheB/CheR fusion protein
MSGILNTLLDINQIEAGIALVEKSDFCINDMLERIRDEFTYLAVVRNISLRHVSSSVVVNTDRHRLEQMVRNLCSNALKYTRSGKILLGCRRRGSMLCIEIWDTGLGIAGEELGSIFDEYHQIVGPGRERSRGLGLGLSIVKRLGDLLGHKVRVKSQPGRGSVFSIEVPMAVDPAGGNEASANSAVDMPAEERHRTGSILVVEDDPEVLNLLAMLVRDEGHATATASDGAAALALIDDGLFQPDLVLADLGLPNGLDGLAVAIQIRERLQRVIPVIILTGDISADSLREIARANCVQMHKPASPAELTQIIQRELAVERAPTAPSTTVLRTVSKDALPVVFVVDDDPQLLASIRMMFEAEGREVKTFDRGEDFLAAVAPEQDGCLLVDSLLPGMSGLELVESMRSSGYAIPAIMITGNSDVATAIAAMKAGAIDFIEKPISRIDLLASVEHGLALSRSLRGQRTLHNSAARHIASLTSRQRQIMMMVLAGEPSKNIAADLGISQRTVENHRAAIMKKTGTRSLPALARLVLSVETFKANDAGKTPLSDLNKV